MSSLNMPGMTDEAKRYVLGLAFKQEQASDLWLGLSLVSEADPVSLATLEENEPTGAPGYSRRRLGADNWPITVNEIDGPKVALSPVTFRNTGVDRWPKLNAVFLTTGDKLISWSFLQTTREAFPGDEMVEGMEFIF